MTSTEQSTTNMPYVRLGKSGLKVSRLILGCMSYGSPEWQGWVLNEEEGLKHIKAAYDMGINAFDTANVYSNGLSEVILGKAIKQYNLPRDEIVVMTKLWGTAIKQYNLPRDEIVVMTKLWGTVGRNTSDMLFWSGEGEIESKRYTNQQGLSRKLFCANSVVHLKHIFESIKQSLERLQLDYVDLLQCHRFDPNTPIEETMQALHDVVKAGYARYIGMSSCYAWQFHKMQSYARQNGLTEFVSMQNFHNAIYREEEREMVPLLQDLGVGMIPWSPLARGFLTRPVTEESIRVQTDGFWKNANIDPNGESFLIKVNERVAEIAKKRGISMAQVALAWSLSKPFISAPIVGTTSLEKLKDLVDGVQVKLTDEEVKAIDELYRPRAISGHK
ncbi:hypothetical protein FRC04_003208 [Tulasnella sp. 424]|nr:hypothetical protein FRC04_003208 [Tulasnella sp. 424]